MTKSRIAAVVITLVALALPATASAADPPSQYQWGINIGSNVPTYTLPSASTPYRIWNYPHGNLGYGKRTWGINLTWGGSGDWEFRRVNLRDHRRLRADETVALYNTAAKAYVVYEKRSVGINLGWSSSARYQWKVARKTFGGNISLYNTVARDFVVYGERSAGINLRWLGDLRPQTGGSGGGMTTGTSTTGSATVWLKADPPVQGYIPFRGSWGQNSSGNVTSIKNPWNNVTLRFVKPGRSSSECGNDSAVVPLGPGKTMTVEERRAAFGLPAGVSNPPLPANFLACVVSSSSYSMVPINITYRLNG